MSTSLKGKRIVILGGTSGIGLATARAAEREGASVVVASSRRPRVDQALAQLSGSAEGHAVDLTDEAQIAMLFERLGAFDHLMFTAGEALQLQPLGETELDKARDFFTLRYFGALMAVKHGAPHIRPGGSIVLTTGIAGVRPQKGWAVAASICGAMEGLTRALAVELAPIRVNTVSPGFVRTELWSNIDEAARETMFRDAGAALPVGRVGEADDIAEAYLYLMREAFSTGQVIVVDGGAVLV
ncbi:MAG: SDR family oxidoreductase [Alphaproteobacteria bacterium]|nr:SDR family oxidoreductase [Alphaproteobacteria bacterium]